MKKTLLTLALTAVCVGAFAQGKIGMVNDATRLIYITSTLGADAALLNQKAPTVTLPSGVNLVVDLFGGATAGTMTLQQSTTLTPGSPGGFGPRNFASLNLAGGTIYTFQVQVRDAAYATADAAALAGSYAGYSAIFTGRPSSGLAFFNINNTTAANFQSTWLPGTFALGGGEFGAIPVGIIPEPSSMALAGLGAASLLLFRRRK